MLRQVLFSVALILGMSPALFSQFAIGISGGPTLSFLQWNIKPLDLDLGYDPGIAWRASVYGEYAFSPVWSLRADVAYQASANKWTNLTDENGFPLPDGSFSDHFSGLNGGLLAKVSPLKNARQLYFLAGPSVTRVAKGWQRIKGGLIEGHDQDWKQSYNLAEKHIRRVQWLADLGVGYGVGCGKNGQLTAEVRYQYGLSDFSTSPKVDARQQMVFVTFGYVHRI